MSELRPAKYPLYRITGGPHAKNLKIEVDGVPLQRVTRAEVVFDTTDAVRIKTFHIAEAEIEVEAHGHTHGETVIVYEKALTETMFGEVMGRKEIARATADTQWEALRDCSDQLRLKADRPVAPGGTI